MNLSAAPPIAPRKVLSRNVGAPPTPHRKRVPKDVDISPPTPPRKRVPKDVDIYKENEFDMEQKIQPFQLQSFDYSSDEYSEIYFITEETEEADSSYYSKLFATEEETKSTFHQKSQAFRQLPKHFEKIKISDENFIEVQFHIKQGFLRASEVIINAKTVDAVRAIVGCHSSNILRSYYDDSTNSVYLVIEEFLLKYLLSLTNEDKDKLRNLEIDFFIVDFITVYLEHPKEYRTDTGDDLYLEDPHMTDVETASRSKHGYVNLSEDKNSTVPPTPKPSAIAMILKPILSFKGNKFQENVEQVNSDGASAQIYFNTAIRTKRITVLSNGVKHISCFTSNKMWISDFDTIKEIDEDGHIIMKLDVEFGIYGRHTTRGGNLLFLKDRSVYILKSNGEIRNLYINALKHSCIHASKITSDIFLASSNGVTRYSEKGKKLKQTQVDDKGKGLYGKPIYITENSNGDIIVSDEQRKAIVVVDEFGRHRFNYKGYHSLPEFNPRGICTDVFGNILVCNHSYHDPSVHLLDENGHFLTSLLPKHRYNEDLPQDVCVDDKHNLYVGCGIKNKIDVYKYIA